MADADAEAMTTPEATRIVVRWSMPFESLARSESASPCPVESKSAIVRQAGLVVSEFERLASMAVDLPAEIGVLWQKGKPPVPR